MVEDLYPKRIFTYLTKNEIEKFWNDHDLELNDWLGTWFEGIISFISFFDVGLTSQLLQQLFCRDFLTPLEQTDVFYSLKVMIDLWSATSLEWTDSVF